MTIHIAIDGTEHDKYYLILKDYFRFKNYRVLTINRQDPETIQELSGNLLYLYNAFYETLQTTSIPDINDYDIVLYNTSMLSDYLTVTEDKLYWIKQINNKTIKKDLYIYIKPDTKPVFNERFNYFKETLILSDTYPIKYMFKLLENKLNDTFNQCYWCNHHFKKDKHHLKYCSKTCSHLANQKQTRDRVNRFNRKYRDVQAPHERNGLGSNALLKSKPNEDFAKEQRIIRNEKRRLGI